MGYRIHARQPIPPLRRHARMAVYGGEHRDHACRRPRPPLSRRSVPKSVAPQHISTTPSQQLPGSFIVDLPS